MAKTCGHCGKEFTGRGPGAKYCSPACYRQRNLDRKMEKYHNDPEYKRRHDLRRYAGHHVPLKPCVVCGNPKSERHHEDITKPLEVLFLCRHHHVQHEKGLINGFDYVRGSGADLTRHLRGPKARGDRSVARHLPPHDAPGLAPSGSSGQHRRRHLPAS